MDAVYGILVLLMGIGFLIGAGALIALILMVIMKKTIKIPGIISGVGFGLFVIATIVLFIVAVNEDSSGTSDDSLLLDEDGNREYEGVEVEGMSDEEIDETISNALESDGIDISEYKEADLNKLYNNEYEDQANLKVTDAEVIAIEPSDEEYGDEMGNIVYAHVDDIPVILWDMVGHSSIEVGGTYTFYGSPDLNEDIGLILISVE